ncbi:MAG: tRNA 4-thiouridine(8) synthase ThiI, partial [FCB group bacterium]|nr:tRNA 4-thiouridine(8) synthase ThiI [FCB group bacterium]
MTEMGKTCILIHYHEIAIKGGNRKWFETIFARNIKNQLEGLVHGKISANSARVFVLDIEPEEWPEYAHRLKNVLGLMNATLMIQVPAELEEIKNTAAALIENRPFETFRVSARRQYKNFPLSSGTLNVEVGAHLQELCGKPVRLKGADLDVKIEVVKDYAYIGADKIKGYGGLPVGVSEKALVLLSSGIDSPVAAFEMLKRGVDPVYVHFHSAPVTSR